VLNRWTSLFILGLCWCASALATSQSGITYQGRILKPDGSPLAGANVQFKLQIRTPNSSDCLMYEEIQALDMRNSNGVFGLTINDGTGSRTDTTTLGLDRIFANYGSFTFNPATCASGSSYTPSAQDGRRLAVLFKDETMSTWEPIPAQTINYVPYAIQSGAVQGYGPDSLVRVVNGSGDPITGLSPLSNAQYTELLALANGTSTNYTKSGQLNGSALPAMNSGEVLGWNGSAWVSTTSTPGANSITSTMIQSGAVTTSQIANNVSINTSGTVGAAVTTTRDFKIYATSPSTYYIDMQAPALTASYNLVWPMNAGSANQVLTTDGAGNLTWAAPAVSSQWTNHATNVSYDGGGNVGIGTTSPTTKLDVNGVVSATAGTSSNPGFTFSGNTNTGLFSEGANAVDIAAGGSRVALWNAFGAVLWGNYQVHNGSSTPYSPTSSSAFSPGSGIDLGSDWPIDGTGTFINLTARNTGTTYQAAYVGAVSNASGTTPTVVIGHQTGASAYAESLRVDPNGRVGIGTTAPVTLLDVSGTIRVGDGGETCGASYTGAIRYNGGNLQFCNGTTWSTLGVAGSGITALTGDVTASGTGSVAATVAAVGGSTAANVHSAELLANAATNANTASTIVKRDASGNFAASAVTETSTIYKDSGSNTVTVSAPTTVTTSYALKLPTAVAASTGQVLASDTSGNLSWSTLPTALPPNGSAGGDLSGTYPNPTVATVGTSTAANVHSAEVLANAATALNTSGALVLRDGSGNFAANVATVNGVALNNAGSILNIVNPIGGAWTMTLPATAGSTGQVMQTNGSGTMSWMTPLTASTAFVNGGNSFGANSNLGNNDNFDLNIKTNNATRMTVTAAGNVGIGTTSPAKVLDVTGTANITGDTTLTSATASTSKTTGALVVTGGLGVGGQVTAGTLNASGSVISQGNRANVYNATDATKEEPFLSASASAKVLVSNTSSVDNSGAYVLMTTRNTATNNQNAYIMTASTTGAGSYTPVIAFGQQTGATAYSERMRIDSSGNVGIGTTSPGYKLDVNGAINATAVKINGVDVTAGNPTSSTAAVTFNSNSDATGTDGGFNFQANGSNLMTISNGGDVAITSSTASSNTTTGALVVSGGIGAAGNINSGGTIQGVDLVAQKSDSTVYSPSSSSVGTPVTGVYSRIYNSSQTDGAASYISLKNRNALSAGTQEAYIASVSNSGAGTYTPSIVIGQQTGATAYAERMRIDANGNVGIGTSSPAAALDLAGGSINMLLGSDNLATTRTNNTIKVARIGTYPYTNTDLPTSVIMSQSSSAGSGQVYLGGGSSYMNAATQLSFYTGAASTATGTERMRIDSSGNVGIGTTSPAYALDVSGEVNIPSAKWYRIGGAGVLYGAATSNTEVRGITGYGIDFLVNGATGTSNSSMIINSSGNVGIGTTAPRAALDVSKGTLLVKPSVSNAGTTVDFSTGNLQHTTNSCQTFTLNNMQDGGSYTFAIKGTTMGTCVFNAYSDVGVTALTVHMPTDHAATVSGKHTLYTFLVMGTDVYVTWIPGL